MTKAVAPSNDFHAVMVKIPNQQFGYASHLLLDLKRICFFILITFCFIEYAELDKHGGQLKIHVGLNAWFSVQTPVRATS